MSVLKVIEILGNSEKGWEDAAAQAIAHASKSVSHIRSVNIQNQSATVKDDKIHEYRVNVKISFEVKWSWTWVKNWAPKTGAFFLTYSENDEWN